MPSIFLLKESYGTNNIYFITENLHIFCFYESDSFLGYSALSLK
jgi:hypothetical protein